MDQPQPVEAIDLGIIGGTGALRLFPPERSVSITTPFGAPSDRPRLIRTGSDPAWFLARHGDPHRIPPHKINYRANIHALRALGVKRVIALNAVGGIDPALPAGALVVPDQIIDYTWGRIHTFSDGGSAALRHVDFTEPFSADLRADLLAAARAAGVEVFDRGCHAVTQGPRLETAAEVRRLARDGSTIVGMTAMPEAALAREAGLEYASLAVVANGAAGLQDGPITEADIHAVLEQAMGQVKVVFDAWDRSGNH